MTIKCVTVPFKNILIITHQHQMSNKLLSNVHFLIELTQIYSPYYCSYESRIIEDKIVNTASDEHNFRAFVIEELTIKSLPLCRKKNPAPPRVVKNPSPPYRG